MEGTAAGLVFGRGATEGRIVGKDGVGNGRASWRRGKAGDRCAEGRAFGFGRVGEAGVGGTRFGGASQNRRRQGEDGGAIEAGDGDDAGLDRAAFADGVPTYRGELLEAMRLFLQ